MSSQPTKSKVERPPIPPHIRAKLPQLSKEELARLEEEGRAVWEQVKAGKVKPSMPATVEDLMRLNRLASDLKQAREKAGISLNRLAELTGITKAALSRFENHRNHNPTVATLTRYAAAVGMRIGYSLEPAEPPRQRKSGVAAGKE